MLLLPLPLLLLLLLAASAATAEDSRLETARRVRDELLAKERREIDRATVQAEAFEDGIAAASERLAGLDATIESARTKAEAMAAARASRQAAADELAAALADLRRRNDARVQALYRAGRLGLRAREGAAAGLGAADPSAEAARARSARLARYLLAVSSAQASGVAALEVEHGAALAALAVAREREEALGRELRILAADRAAAESDLARAEEEADALRRRADEVAAGLEAADAPVAVASEDTDEAWPDPDAADASTIGIVPGQAGPGGAQDEAAGEAPPGDGGDGPEDPLSTGAGPTAASGSEAAVPTDDGVVAEADDRPAAEDPGSRPGLLSRLFGDDADTDRFAASRGQLPVPVPGKVVAGYGQQHKSGATYRGVILRAAGGDRVSAVADGRVIFAGSLSGLGRTVIVSHGGRYHTVYARLGDVDVREGDRVSAGAVVGALPQDDADLHFELREAGKAVDPVPWLRSGVGGLPR